MIMMATTARTIPRVVEEVEEEEEVTVDVPQARFGVLANKRSNDPRLTRPMILILMRVTRIAAAIT